MPSAPTVWPSSIWSSRLSREYLVILSTHVHTDNGIRIVLVYCIPIALAHITWKMYFINGGWNVISLILIVSGTPWYQTNHFRRHGPLTGNTQIVFWVETKGTTLEEIDAIFMGEKHSDVPNIEDIRTGKKTIDVSDVKEAAEVKAIQSEL